MLDSNINRLRQLDDIYGQKLQTLFSNAYNIALAVKKADLLIGSVLIPGALTPKLVTEDMVKTMKKGSAIVDVAIDQGGCIATTARHGATYHDKPTFMEHGVVHYSVGNMPGAVARTSTFALTNATMPYMIRLAGQGWKTACREDRLWPAASTPARGMCFSSMWERPSATMSMIWRRFSESAGSCSRPPRLLTGRLPLPITFFRFSRRPSCHRHRISSLSIKSMSGII